MFLYNTSWFQAPRYHGLFNRGATCYLNSVLQVLFMTKDFREAVERHADGNPPTQLIDHHLNALFSDLQKNQASTYDITTSLGIDNAYEQRDAAEYFEKILRRTSDGASRIFHGRLSHQTRCCKCGKPTVTDEAFWHLPLALVDSCSDSYRVEDGIGNFFGKSVFSGEDQMYCDRCDAKVDATAQYVMTHHPDVLILLLKRFEFSYHHMSYVKISREVDVPSVIEIPEIQTYELYAFVDHCGDLRGGHYTATIKDEDKWYKFNDSSVTLCQYQPFQLDDTKKSRTAQLLFYRKKRDDHMSTSGGVTRASIHGRLGDAEMIGQPIEGDVEMGDDTELAVSVGGRGVELSEGPGNEVSVRQFGPHRNQEDGYLLDASVNIQEGTLMGEVEEDKRVKVEADDQTENVRLLSPETKPEESIRYNEEVGDSERMLDANVKSEDSVRPELYDRTNKQDETSHAQGRVTDEMTGDEESEKPPIDYFNRDAEHLRDKQEDEKIKTDIEGVAGRTTGANELPSVRPLTIYDLLKGTTDQHNSDPEYKQGSSGRLDVRGYDEQKRRDQGRERKEKKSDRNETPDNRRPSDAPQNRNTCVEYVVVEEEGGVETRRYEVKKGVGDSAGSKRFDNQEREREISHTVGRHVGETMDIKRDDWKGQRRGSAREWSDGGKGKDSGRLDEGIREKHVKKQADKSENAQVYKKEDCGHVGWKEEQERGREQMSFHNKRQDYQPDVGSVQPSLKEESEEDTGNAKTNSHTVGRHVGETMDSQRDDEQGQWRGSAKEWSESGKIKDSGRLDEGIREKHGKKQAEEKEDKGEHAQVYNREDCGQVGCREKQERGSERMTFHNKRQDNQPIEEDRRIAMTSSHIVGRHVGETMDIKRDDEKGQWRGSARKWSDGGKGKEIGRLDEGIREKHVKKQADKSEHAQIYYREDCGQVGCREKQESGREQMDFHNKGQDNQPSVEDRSPAKANKRKRPGWKFPSVNNKIKRKTKAAEESSNSSHDDGQTTDNLTERVDGLMINEPEPKNDTIGRVIIKARKRNKQKCGTSGCFSGFLRSRQNPEQSGEED